MSSSGVDMEAEAEVRSRASRSFVGHARLIGLLTLVSRILGLAREIVFGHFIGAGLVGSAFTVAFSIPNLFRKLFGEGALSAAFIPLYAQQLKADRDDAQRFAAGAVNLLVLILLVITLAGEALLAGLLWVATPERMDYILTLKLTMVMLPYVVLICGGAFLSGVLQVHQRFGAPAFAPVLLNVCHIAVILIGAWILGLRGSDSSPGVVDQQTMLVYWQALFVLVAGVLQVVILFPGLRASGFRFRLESVWTPAVRKMVRLSVPVGIGAGVLQLSVLLDKAISVVLMQSVDQAGNAVTHFSFFGQLIAFPMELGAPARLYYAQIMYQFPLGIFAIALATAIFPTLSAHAFEQDRTRFRQTLRHGIEAALWEGIPASIGLVLVAGPAVRLLFQHGQIDGHDATLIARSVMFYGAAVWAFSLQQILSRAYYALHDTWTPLVMSIVTLLVNLIVELPLVFTPLGEAGMAAGTLASFSVQALVMLWMLDRKVGGLEMRHSLRTIGKMLVAAGIMWAACWGVQRMPIYPAGETRRDWLLQVLLISGVGGAVYLGACAALRMEMMKHLLPCRRK